MADHLNKETVTYRLAKMDKLKKKGNAEFVKNEKAAWAKSAVIYGELLQEMMTFEKDYPWRSWDTEQVLHVFDHEQILAFDLLKPTAFLNLGAANLKLQGFEGTRRCCNAALLFINSPSLLLDDMGADGVAGSGDITEDVVLSEPVQGGRAVLKGLAAKALYRRAVATQELLREYNGSGRKVLGKSSYQAGDAASIQKALQGLHAASRVAPVDSTSLRKQIDDLLVEFNKLDASAKNDIEKPTEGAGSSHPPTPSGVVLTKAELDGMQVNGGMCLRRSAYWSQTVLVVTIHIPLCSLILNDGQPEPREDGSQWVTLPPSFKKSDLQVRLQKAEVQVIHEGDTVLHSVLEYNISPLAAGEGTTWTLEALGADADQASHLVLHLLKQESLEWYPGCEWWDRVFVDDEAIDTTTCKVNAGTSSSELPPEAMQRAEREHARFMQLGRQEQHKELKDLDSQRKTLVSAIDAHNQEQDRGRTAVPERGEMLDALSAEFPNIFVGTK